MNINFTRVDDHWVMQINHENDTLPVVCFDEAIDEKDIIDMAVRLAQGDIISVNVNFTRS